MGFAAAQRANIETLVFQCRLQSKIIDFGIMGNGRNRRVAINQSIAQHILGPFRQTDRGKPLLSGKGGARINDCQIKPAFPHHWYQRLGNMHRTDYDNARRRQFHIEKVLLPAKCLAPGFAGPKPGLRGIGERIVFAEGITKNQPAFTTAQMAHENDGAPVGAGGIQFRQKCLFHVYRT